MVSFEKILVLWYRNGIMEKHEKHLFKLFIQ